MTPEQLADRIRHDDVSLVRFLYCDNANIVRGKSALAATAPNFVEAGIGLTVAMQGFTMTERIAPGASVGPVGEIRLVPDLDTYVSLPYASRQGALLCDMQTLDGQPWELCPRSLLKRTLAAAADAGFEVQVGFEHEFYLARQAGDDYLPLDDSLCFSSEGMNSAAPVIMETLDALQAQGVQPVQYYPELGPGQQEISIQHGPALRSADNEILARETIRGVARNHGLVASFAPKPFPNQAGSGNHIHLSLWREGRNLFYNPDDPLGISELAYGFIAGLLQHLPALLAITCPSVNSYERLAPGMWSSAYVCFGPDNREASVRIASPFRGHEEGSTNIELKAIDASSNPYLALSAVIAAGLDGVRRDLRPGEPLTTNPSALSEPQLAARGIRRFPTTLRAACAALEADDLLASALGPRLAQDFIAIRQAEWEDLQGLPLVEQTRRHFTRY
jgi:glutamine synthetase